MWQDILVYAIVALAAGLTLWKLYQKFSGKAPCCNADCSCKGSCPSGTNKTLCGSGKDAAGLEPFSGAKDNRPD